MNVVDFEVTVVVPDSELAPPPMETPSKEMPRLALTVNVVVVEVEPPIVTVLASVPPSQLI